jgi:hypothetical protein
MNVFSEYSSGASYISSNYYPTLGAAGYKTSLTESFGAAGISVSGTSGSGNSGLIQFFVDPATSKTAGNAFTPTERARITSDGNLLVGGTTSSNRLTVTGDAANDVSVFISPSGGTGVKFTRFAVGGGAGTEVGSVSYNGSTGVLYNITSDQRLKENIQNADSASSLIDAIKVRQYNWKSDGSHTRYGFIAQELVTVAPEAVHQPEDPEEMMAVDYSKLVPMLVKEIQSLRKRLADAGI